MARIPLFAAALTVGTVLAAAPLASATDPATVATPPATETPAMNGNLLPMAMCGARDQIIAELSDVFSEEPLAVGQVDERAVVEIFASEQGSWTIIATGTDGTSCIVSAGEGFESTFTARGADA